MEKEADFHQRVGGNPMLSLPTLDYVHAQLGALFIGLLVSAM
jgi:hypothetical protein